MTAATKGQINAWVELGDRHVLELQDLAYDRDKETAKYARRALHLLRTRGVHAPVPPRPPSDRSFQPVLVDAPYDEHPARAAMSRAQDVPLMVAALAGVFKARRRRNPPEEK